MNETIYTGGCGVNFDNNEELRDFIIQHRVNKEDFEIFTDIQSGLEIRTESGKIIQIVRQTGDEKVSGRLELLLPNSAPHEIFWLKPSSHGQHQLGGKLPHKLKIVTDQSFLPLYLGYLNCYDERFSWLGLHKLYLFYPLDFYYEPVFIDYSNELSPELLKGGTKSEYRPQKYLSPLRFDSTTSVTIEEIQSESDPIHQCGVPLWVQYPELPRCPKTGELMRFVCSISSTRRIHEMKKRLFWSKNTGKYLMFGDVGILYVFFHPKSKILYLTIQF